MNWRYFSVPGNRICWRVDVQLESKSYDKSSAFRNSEWGSESTSSIHDALRSFKLPIGTTGKYFTIGNMIDSTESENISKVILEEKLYTTWYHRRTVLIGDACHKMLPNAGKGAVTAMMDAVALANAIYEIADNATPENILSAFRSYYRERYDSSKKDLISSQSAAKLLAGQTWKDSMRRKLMFKMAPFPYKLKAKTLANRPQATFLPKVKNRGTGFIKLQKESIRYQLLKAKSTVI
ncbi:hypothetical protein BGX27_008628 [Mortierella sp. AM989]|nr:hypothetical protein BGX27_008628 [Mortierella sp. AM989]